MPASEVFNLGEAGDRQEFADKDDQKRQHRDHGHPGGQPAQPFGAREQIANQLVGPKSDSQRNQNAQCAEEQAAEQRTLPRRDRWRRFGDDDVGLVEDVDLGRHDDRAIRLHRAWLSR